MPTEREQRLECLTDTIHDLVGSFLYDDRKADEDLPRDAIEEMVNNGEITAEEIASIFEDALIDGLGEYS